MEEAGLGDLELGARGNRRTQLRIGKDFLRLVLAVDLS